MSDITNLIHTRRAVYPKSYTTQPISREDIEAILESANCAPTHKRTEPWRFKVFESAEARHELGEYLANAYRAASTPENFSPEKYAKTLENTTIAGCVIAICVQYDPDGRLPQWEELAATAMAVQNMWLTAHARGIGAYWSSPGSILKANDFLQLNQHEACLGLFYMGHHNLPEMPAIRKPIADKVVWR